MLNFTNNLHRLYILLQKLFRSAESLVLPSLKIASDAAFRDIAVSSESCMSLHECSPANLLDYIFARKAQGYVVVGLEQTARSQRLGVVQLPERMVLLLGAEREGIPSEILQHLDMCVEIPQFGVIRSLNVHVSGALLAWEYTNQRLATNKQTKIQV
jgi:tRNA guanosine-2'-O-methyltransferase